MATGATSTHQPEGRHKPQHQPPTYNNAEDARSRKTSSFFSSVYTAGQQAAQPIYMKRGPKRQDKPPADTTLPPLFSNNAKRKQNLLPSLPSSRPRSALQHKQHRPSPPAAPAAAALPSKTLGQGDLSLAQLGLSRSRANTGSSSKHKSPLAQGSHTSVKSTKSPSTPNGRSRAATETSEHRRSLSPPLAIPGRIIDKVKTELADIEDDHLPVVKRLRSQRLSRGGSSRKRADSAKELEPTPTTATVANTAATPEDITPVTSAAASITGFAYASKKRNEEFHAHFKSVPEDDFLLDDFSCAYSREILVQGRMFVSERHICFFANILGWQTHHVIAFDEIVSLDKKTTAGLFPNGIVVQTLHSTYIYASFISRDATFAFMNTIWKQNSQGVAGSDESDGDSDDGELDSGISDNEAENRRPPGLAVVASAEAGADASKWSVPNLGPETHAPTSPGYDPEAKGEKLLCKEIVKAPLGVVANLLFGKENVLGAFLKDNQKCWDVTPIKSCVESKKREYSYVKPLNNSLGPKQTKCQCVDNVEAWDDTGAINVVTTTSNHDVPSGNAFTTKTRIIMTWAANNQTQVMMSCWFDWTGKSWIKSAIEKGGNDGQMAFAADLIPYLNERAKGSGKSAKPVTATAVAVPTKKGHAKHKSHHHKVEAAHEEASSSSAPPPQTGGALHQFAETWSQIPILGSLPLPIVGAVLGGIWVLWFIIGLFRGHHTTTHKFDFAGLSDAKKLEIFVMEEEYELWHWIDERVGKSQRTPGRFFVPFEGANPKMVDFSKSKTAAAGGGDNAEDMTQADLEEAIRDSEANLQQLRDIKASML
ncbi:uncharacterized protein YALI1_A16215g [Yarrowia lipolytica]|uniref:VASt domain-containing protein n=1 Tax=Yarrowia lipolytica TaxID=4952 RepID=A0A1D8N509_YARLL|nr:hypothetical protein YALI1_A16215g [Yarrowia lipolytica]